MPPILGSDTEKMARSWYDYGHGRLERLASEEQRSWLHSTSQLPAREPSLEPFNGLGGLNLGNNHSNDQGQSSQQFHRNSSLDNAVEDLLNNHFLSRAQRSESLATSNPEFCPISGRLQSNSMGGRLSSNQITSGSGRHSSNQSNGGNGRYSSNRIDEYSGGSDRHSGHSSNQIAEYSGCSDRHSSNHNQINGGRHASNSLAGRLSSLGSIDLNLNTINDRVSSIGSLGDVNELLGNSAANGSRSGNSIHPSSESAVLYMEMLKSGYAPHYNDQSLPNGMNESRPPQQQEQQHQEQQQQQQQRERRQPQSQSQPSAADLLMRHRLISLEARPEELGRVPANLENLTNRLLENEKENKLIASTMASMMERGNAKPSETSKAVLERISGKLQHQGRKISFFGSSDRAYMNEPEPPARLSPRRTVAPRRFLDLNDMQDKNRMLPPPIKADSSRLPDEASRLPSEGSNRKEDALHRSDEVSCSTAEASRSTAELLIQLNQGKLSSRTPSDNLKSANSWNQDPSSQERHDSSHYQGSASSSRSSPSRRSVPPRSFLSSNYVQDIQGPTPTKSMTPASQQPDRSFMTEPMVGEKRSATDMLQVKQEDFKSKAKSSPTKNAAANNAATKNAATRNAAINDTETPAVAGLKRFKPYHEDKWMENFHQLLKFKEEHGNCLVPHTYLPNPLLARWVKRQRRQYKLCLERCPQSTMTPERIEILNKEGFVWDSHEITWMRKFYDLIDYRKIHGHCRVPSCSKDHPQLATWVKCQRRQYRLKREGKSSAMTTQRIKLLDDVGFSWEVRFAAPAPNT